MGGYSGYNGNCGEKDMYNGKKVTAIIGAAGSGTRMGGALPKQFMKIDGRTILERAAAPFERMAEVDEILVVANQDFVMYCREVLQDFQKVTDVISGGEIRQESIGNGLRHLAAAGGGLADRLVLIHDGARPFVTEQVISSVLEAADRYGAAVPVVPCKDTVRQMTESGRREDGGRKDCGGSPEAPVPRNPWAAPASGGGWPAHGAGQDMEAPVPSRTLDRSMLCQVQTPQGFHGDLLLEAFAAAERDGFTGTDDASLVERLGYPVALAAGSYENKKITTREDLPMEVRVGTGFDVHRLTEGRKLILGGVEIPYEKGLLGHSDADVMVHALMDAMLGAAGLGDIGRHFPDTDPAYKGISSLKLLELVRGKVADAGYTLGNADVTIIAQKPKLAGHIPAMEENLVRVLQTEAGKINVKATTTEKLGFTGRGEGIAAEAVCTLVRR